jgi:hypothetical protein
VKAFAEQEALSEEQRRLNIERVAASALWNKGNAWVQIDF